MKRPFEYWLAEDTITSQEQDSAGDWLKTHPRMTMGPVTLEYEKKWSNWVGRKYSVACNSGSSANELAAAALLYARILNNEKTLKNKRVIVPSVGWVTTISPFIHMGFEPYMCEADPDTFGLDLRHLDQLLEAHDPAVVMYVQVLGVPNRMEDLLELQRRYGFYLIEDSCAAMGSSYKGRKVGTFGDMSTVSTYFGHQFSTIEGGFVSTDDEDFYHTLLMLRSHGWTKDLPQEVKERIYRRYNVDSFNAPFLFVLPGYNFRITDVQSYIGLGQLDKMDWLVQKRFKNHQQYKKLLDPYLLSQQYYDKDNVVCSIHYGALAKSNKEREAIVAALHTNGIETRMFSAGNLGRHPFWYEAAERPRFTPDMADKIHYCGFFLPNHPSLEPGDIDFIAGVVIKAVLKHREGELR